MPSETGARLLIVDDDAAMTSLLADRFSDHGYQVSTAASGEEALAVVRARMPDVVVTDVNLGAVDGYDVLDGIKELDATIRVILMTAFGDKDRAIKAMRRGAYQYFEKSNSFFEELLLYVQRAIDDRRLRSDNRNLRRLVEERSSLEAMVGRSQVMRGLADLVERVAQANVPVLVRGESGAGKELVARAVHFSGPRRDGPFVAVNCTTIPAALLESELFGHVRGAYTGASVQRRGLFVEADRGTLFLDEIGDMPLELQAKLLRVLEGGEIRPVGADTTRKVDVRIVAASHQPLEERVAQGRFRADLFYRLNVVPVTVPPLRERVEDIPLLIEHFLERARADNPGCRAKGFTPELKAALARRSWPGNVRELESVVKRLVILASREVVDVGELELFGAAPLAASPAASMTAASAGAPGPGSEEGPELLARAKTKLMKLDDLKDEYISWVIRHCEGNKSKAAEILGIDVSTIHRREKALK